MPAHTTNYVNTFIEVAEDCPSNQGTVPPLRGNKKSIANLQFDMLHEQPYVYTSDEVLFGVYALRKQISSDALAEAREQFFSKGQPCFRASPLTKTYGWGVHSDEHGKIAIYGLETEAYRALAADASLQHVKAMRSRRK